MSDLGIQFNVDVANSEALEALMRLALDKIIEREMIKIEPWITQAEAMKLMRIKSKATFLKYRDLKKFKYSRPTESAKYILYDRKSILDFIEQGIVTDEDQTKDD